MNDLLGMAPKRDELRRLAVDYIAWKSAGCPTGDEYDTYPSDLWPALADPCMVLALLDEIERLESKAAGLYAAIKRENDFRAYRQKMIAEDLAQPYTNDGDA